MLSKSLSVLTVLSAVCSCLAQLKAVPYVSGLTRPLAMIQDPSRPDTQYVVQQAGIIRVVQDGAIRSTNFLNVTGIISSDGERGLLGLALAPDYATSGFAYIYYTNVNGDIQIARYSRSSVDPLVLDPGSARGVINIKHFPTTLHNGGTLAFGPDGLLYAGIGDAGDGFNAQNPNLLLGKMIRLDPSGDDFPLDMSRNYSIPNSNPFANGGGQVPALGEIWAFGYRNPWKFSFDDPARGGNGGLIVADVGFEAWEEVDYEPAGSGGGRNYGWPQREGAHNFLDTTEPAYRPLVDPIFEYHRIGGRSITGGCIYRGEGLGARYKGRYFFGDYVAHQYWSIKLEYDGGGEATASDLQEHTSEFGLIVFPVSFGTDAQGELYFMNIQAGIIYKIRPATNTLDGHISLGQFSGPLGGQQITVKVRAVGSSTNLDTYSTTLDSDGNFSVGTLRSGTFDVMVQGTHWLGKLIHNVVLGSGTTNLSVSLVNGDVNGDNAITATDFGQLRSAFGTSAGDPNWNANADLDGDGYVSLADFAILRSHFGESGDP